jgi:hypothetical protein
MSENTLLWFGNVAKFEIGNEIKSIANSTDRELVVVDLGAGRGGDWDKIAAECRNVRICLWEPHKPTLKYLEKRFHGSNIEIHENLESLNGIADIGTSLSVLEHVDKKISHFQIASLILNKEGIFYMNFDDGHFRYSSENIFSLGEYRLPLAEAWRTVLSKFPKKILATNKFQKKVLLNEFLQCIEQSDLELVSVRFRHLAGIKATSRLINDHDFRLEFMNAWLDFEIETEKIINASHENSSLEKCWELFATRTAVFRKADV